ncbi:ABC transporter permease [Cerasicoccus maritimus]|uniref:ABC transporter permease n=1 Tax=Cerasicoccus maritimus TaxID=490089 RepID=UPI002852746A|nr:ABC transporter permease [Cerasicoccus maritimus]
MKLLHRFKQSDSVVVEANTIGSIDWAEVWKFRELFLSLAWRDLLVRYKQTFIGVVWAVLDPLLSMIVLVLIFGVIAKMKDSTPVVVFAGMLPWQMFGLSLNSASNSLMNNASILSKIYFPRIILPTSSVAVNLVDLVINYVILAILMLIYGYQFTWKFLLVVPISMMGIAIALGISFFVSCLYVKYRDFKILLPFVLKIGLLVTPVGYQLANKEEIIQILLSLNPLTGVVECCRWAVLPNYDFFLPSLYVTFACILLLWYTGERYFRRSEQWLNDVI